MTDDQLLFATLNNEDIIETFHEKKLQKTKQSLEFKK